MILGTNYTMKNILKQNFIKKIIRIIIYIHSTYFEQFKTTGNR